MERNWATAIKSGDTVNLNQIVAGDWIWPGLDGGKATKKEALDNVRTGVSNWTHLSSAMEVMVNGTFAAIHGAGTEKSSCKRKNCD